MRVLVAFDKFKDSLTAVEACSAAARAILQHAPGTEVDACPLSDGGEGFAPLLTRSAGGTERRVEVTGPLGARVTAALGEVQLGRVPAGAREALGLSGTQAGTLALADMASASGLALLDRGQRDPLRTSTVGTGQLILAAARLHPAALLLGVGGSATHDLGLGALGALGIGFRDPAGRPIPEIVPGDWPRLAGLEGAVAPAPPILIACDVDNPVLGPRGALAVYGRQKGLRESDAPALEAQTSRVVRLVCGHFGKHESLAAQAGAGAAGGIAFGLMAGCGAGIVPGFDLVASWLDLKARIRAADVVVTGEGRFDDSSLSGKGPGSVASWAAAEGKPVHVFAGQVALSRPVPGIEARAITPQGMELGLALAQADRLLSAAVAAMFAAR